MGTQTFQYGAVKTKSFNAGTRKGPNVGDGHYGPPVSINDWQSDTGLAQGRYATNTYTAYRAENPGYTSLGNYTTYDGPFYGHMHFGSGAGKPTELAGKTVASARIFLKRYSTDPWTTNPVPVDLYATTLTDVPGSGALSGGATLVCSLTKGQGGYFDIPVALAQSVVDGKGLAIYSGSDNNIQVYGIESADKPVIEITITVADPTPPTPSLTTPGIGAVSDALTQTKTLGWQASSDSGGVFTPADLHYELKVSRDGGSTYGSVITTAAGAVSDDVDLVAYFSLAAHYYNANCVFAVRAVSPSYNGTVYYSSWAVSSVWAIDYRVVMNVPILYSAMQWRVPESDFGDAFALKIVTRVRLRGKGGSCRITPIAEGVPGIQVAVELPESAGIVDVYCNAKGRTIGFLIDNGIANQDGGYDPIEIYDMQALYDAEEI